jgi:hypothetical protein
MSTHSIEDSTTPARAPSAEVKGSAMRGALIGLIPLGLLAGVILVTLVITALAREFVAGSGFFVQQQAALITLIVGLVLAILVFAIACWRVMRHVAAWQQTEVRVQANAALWMLGATALIIVIPVLLAFFLPQHPAP